LAESTTETTVALPYNVHRLTLQACCCKLAIAVLGHRQLNSTLAHNGVNTFSIWHRHGTDVQMDKV